MMTDRQRERLISYRQCLLAERSALLQQRVRDSLNKRRQVTPLLKLKVIGLHNNDIDNKKACKVSFFLPKHYSFDN